MSSIKVVIEGIQIYSLWNSCVTGIQTVHTEDPRRITYYRTSTYVGDMVYTSNIAFRTIKSLEEYIKEILDNPFRYLKSGHLEGLLAHEIIKNDLKEILLCNSICNSNVLSDYSKIITKSDSNVEPLEEL